MNQTIKGILTAGAVFLAGEAATPVHAAAPSLNVITADEMNACIGATHNVRPIGTRTGKHGNVECTVSQTPDTAYNTQFIKRDGQSTLIVDVSPLTIDVSNSTPSGGTSYKGSLYKWTGGILPVHINSSADRGTKGTDAYDSQLTQPGAQEQFRIAKDYRLSGKYSTVVRHKPAVLAFK